MKRILAFCVISVLGFAATALAGPMANTKHDLSSGSTAGIRADVPGSGGTDQLCIFCHTPHNGSPAAGRPLWNHALTAQNLTWAPTTTVRGTALPTDITSAALNGARACMSCHDGTVAVGSVLNYNGAANTFTMVASTKLTAGKLNGTSNAYLNSATMETNHPVGVSKPAAAAGFTDFNNVAAGSAVNYDQGGYVKCGSCHNPHLNTYSPFLKIDNAGSAICVTCHNL